MRRLLRRLGRLVIAGFRTHRASLPIDSLSTLALYPMAFVWRTLLVRTTFIAITGSVGKTTAKECLAAILSARVPTGKTSLNQDDRYGVPRTILRIRPWHRFAVVEVGIDSVALMKRSARLVRPHVAVILNVARTHKTQLKTLEEHAEAKSLLLRKLRPGGVAILNADDRRVAAMAVSSKCHVRTFGTSSSFDFWADDVSARWPGRLEFEVHSGVASQSVSTRLVGAHWLTSALGAMAAANCCGVPLGEAAKALSRVEAFPGRMLPVQLPNGAVFLRDDYNASIAALEPALRVLKEAVAVRRWLVIEDFSDFGKNRVHRLRFLASMAWRVADKLILIGEESAYGCRQSVKAGLRPEDAHHFATIQQAAEFLRAELASGDLVLLKGRTTDHVTRIFFAQLGPIKCWQKQCFKRILCDFCSELGATEEDRREAVIVPPSVDT